MDEKTRPAPRRLRHYLPLLTIVAVALIVRAADLPGKWLWYDELQSVTHAGLPIWALIKSVLSFDPHPPLYYVQLHFWMLLNTSDEWIKLNSVLWSVLTVVSVYVLSKELFNTKLAILASLLFAISPFAVSYAQEARMYSLLMFLGVWSFYFTYRFFAYRGVWPAIGVAVFTTAFLYSHGAGFMLLVSLYSYAGLVLLESKPKRWKVFLQYASVQALVLALYLPWLVKASTIRVGHTQRPDLNDVIDTLFILLGGRQMHYSIELSWVVVVPVMAGITVIALRNATVRALAVSFLLAPILFCIAASYISRPIWIYRTFAYTAPFLSIVLASTVLEISSSIRLRNVSQDAVRYSLMGGFIAVLTLGLVIQQITFSYQWNFRDAAEYLRANVKNDDVIYVPGERVFWGLGWYLAGPKSVNPLAVDLSLISRNGVRVVSKAALGNPIDHQRYWLVYRSSDDIAPFEPQRLDRVFSYNDLLVAQVQK